MGKHLPSVLIEHLSEQLTYLAKTTVFLKNFFILSYFISLTKTSNIAHDITVVIPQSAIIYSTLPYKFTKEVIMHQVTIKWKKKEIKSSQYSIHP